MTSGTKPARLAILIFVTAVTFARTPVIRDPEGARLRLSPEANQGGLVELEQEMQIVRDYLEIEQGRPGARLRYSLDAAGTTRTAGHQPDSG